jgi:hypothetical protein
MAAPPPEEIALDAYHNLAVEAGDQSQAMGLAALANEFLKLRMVNHALLQALPADQMPADQRTRLDNALQSAARGSVAVSAIALQGLENEARTSDPPTMTTIPIEPADPVQNIENVKTHKIPQFSGDPNGIVSCLSWLDHIMSLSVTSKLSHVAIIEVMKTKADGLAHKTVLHGKEQGLSLAKIVAHLEVEFANVPPPAEARVTANTMMMNGSEEYAAFARRLKDMIRMAVRDIREPVQKRSELESLCKTNLYRVLPGYLHNHLADLEMSIARNGRRPMDFEDMIMHVQTQSQIVKTRRQRNEAEKEMRSLQLNNERRGKGRSFQVEEYEADWYMEQEAQIWAAYEDTLEVIEEPIMYDDEYAAATNYVRPGNPAAYRGRGRGQAPYPRAYPSRGNYQGRGEEATTRSGHYIPKQMMELLGHC